MTLILDRVILHTVMHHFLWTDGQTDLWTFETHSIRSTWGSRSNNATWSCIDSALNVELVMLRWLNLGLKSGLNSSGVGL